MTTQALITRIKELRELAEKATPGKWEASQSPDEEHTDAVYARYLSGAEDSVCLVGRYTLDQQNNDSAHIASHNPAAMIELYDAVLKVLEGR